MLSFLVAGAIGLVSTRWASGTWILIGVATAAISQLTPGPPGMKALALTGTVASYNLGLIIGLTLTYLKGSPMAPRAVRGAASADTAT